MGHHEQRGARRQTPGPPTTVAALQWQGGAHAEPTSVNTVAGRAVGASQKGPLPDAVFPSGTNSAPGHFLSSAFDCCSSDTYLQTVPRPPGCCVPEPPAWLEPLGMGLTLLSTLGAC